MFAREEDGGAICTPLDRGTFNWNEGTNIEPCSLSEFSAGVSLSLSPPHYTAAVAAIKIVQFWFLMAKWSYFFSFLY